MDIESLKSEEELITALKQAEQRIYELEQRLHLEHDAKIQSVINASPIPYAVNDGLGNITYLNPAFIHTFGYQLEDIPNLTEWWPKAYPDPEYRAWAIKTWLRHLENAQQSGQSFEALEIRIRCKDGSFRTVLASAAPLQDSLKGEHLVILYDITERKQFEEQLYEHEKELVEIFDHLPSMIFLKSAEDLRYVRFNRAGEILTGIKREDLIGKNDYDFFPREQADFFTDRDRAVLSSGKLDDIPDEFIDTPMGTRSLHTRKVPIFDMEGKVKYLLGISDDITEQKAMEKERSRLVRQLQQAHKMESLGQLSGGIAHDFNNLLAIISGFTQLALLRADELEDEKLNDYLTQVQAAEERATSLVSQMLAFSRNDKVESQPLSLASYLKQDLKMLRATLPSSIQIKSHIENDLPNVMMNPTQLNQILMNLAINARDAMEGSGLLEVSLDWARGLDLESPVSHETIKGDWIALSVKDNGCGIEKVMLESIFMPFYTSKPVGKGTGMGLAVVYGIVTNCGGHIVVESEKDEGTVFRVLFPPLDKGAQKQENSNLLSLESLKGSGERVLVIDDEESLARFIGMILSQYNYSVDVVTDSLEAFNAIKEKPEAYNLVVTDQTMPKMTGTELIEQLKQINPQQKVILCSGYGDKLDEDTIKFEDVYYFQKPVDTKLFVKKVHELVS